MSVDLPTTYPCPVRGCRRVWSKQGDVDMHVVAKHVKTQAATEAGRRLDASMKEAFTLGAKPVRAKDSTSALRTGMQLRASLEVACASIKLSKDIENTPQTKCAEGVTNKSANSNTARFFCEQIHV